MRNTNSIFSLLFKSFPERWLFEVPWNGCWIKNSTTNWTHGDNSVLLRKNYIYKRMGNELSQWNRKTKINITITITASRKYCFSDNQNFFQCIFHSYDCDQNLHQRRTTDPASMQTKCIAFAINIFQNIFVYFYSQTHFCHAQWGMFWKGVNKYRNIT